MRLPLICIILVNYNGYEDTIECIKSLKKVCYENYRIIVVDNNSQDDSVKNIKKNIDEKIILIESKVNKGFSHGNNLGIKKAIEIGADYVLLLNNDTIVDKMFLINMLNTFNLDEKIGIVSCKMMYYPEIDKIWFGGGTFKYNKFLAIHENYKENDFQDNKIREITFATGCCMLIPIKVINNIGMLPEEYFMYFEDVDYCLKVLQEGYKILYNPNAVIYHKVSVSTGGENSEFYLKWATRNRYILINKYKSLVSKFNYYKLTAFFTVTRMIKIAMYMLKGEKAKSKAIMIGLKEGMSYSKSM